MLKVVVQNSKLSSLDLASRGGWAELWTVLSQTGMHLREISTNTVDDHLLRYLASYSRVERLSLSYPGVENATESDRFADMFFTTILP
ncbi:hypothetical protein B0H10DRAFT_576777 [Mycena sp. CBHHK59/15]|nr:hypothetical protein B0H10DRAFT_576777 [Mycena sp. CBHHK59/15]